MELERSSMIYSREEYSKKEDKVKNMPDCKIFAEHVEEKALSQINSLIAQPAFSECKVRIMPDVHAGAGCVIGFTADLGDKVIPNVVGVDIGCGMLTVELGKIDFDFKWLDFVIREFIPSGRNVHKEKQDEFEGFHELYCYEKLKNPEWIRDSVGTLGGGNHFIEIDVDDDGNKYLIIHTGSRNLGKQVAEYYQKLAIINMGIDKECLEHKESYIISYLKDQGRQSEIDSVLRAFRKNFQRSMEMPKELCYLEGRDKKKYLDDMNICQYFARLNRFKIADKICDEMGWEMKNMFETVHNYIDIRTNIIRKGAVRASEGERVLIPINMRDGCIIGIGKGNKDWNCSAPHGAGRIMSRMEAKKKIQLADYKRSMEGIYTTSVSEDTIDECPMAYKPMDEIVKLIEPTVEIERIIKPIYNFKASE